MDNNEMYYKSVFSNHMDSLGHIKFSENQKLKLIELLNEHSGDILPAYQWLRKSGKMCSPRDIQHFSTQVAMIMSDPEDPWSVSLDTTFRIKLCKVWNKDSALGWLTRATMSSIDPTWIADQLQDRWTWDQVLNLKKKHKIYAPEELNSSKGKGKFTKIQIEELVRRYYKPESVGLINRPSYVQLAEYSMSEWDVKTQPATLSKLMKEYKPDVEQKETQ